MQSKVSQIVAGRTNVRTLDALLNEVPVYIESALEYNDQLSSKRCASCGSTDNLRDGIAGGNTIPYCGKHAREEERP